MKQIAFILVILALATPAEAIDVKLSSSARVSGTHVTVGDVAKVSGGGKAVLALVRDVRVGELPTSGDTEVTVEQVRRSLFAAGLNMAEIDLAGSSRVEVHRAKASRVEPRPGISGADSLRREIRRLVAAQKGVSEKAIAVQIVEGDAGVIPETAKIRLVCLEPLPESGRMRFEVRPAGKETSFKPFRVTARIDAMMVAVVATRTLAAGTEIKSGDVKLAVFAASSAPTGTLKKVDDAVGGRVSRRVEAGSAIAETDLAQDTLVRRGEECTVVVQGKGFHIATKAVAREDGAMGDEVKLEKRTQRTRSEATGDGPPRMRRYTTRERFTGVVTGRRRVEIRATGEDQ